MTDRCLLIGGSIQVVRKLFIMIIIIVYIYYYNNNNSSVYNKYVMYIIQSSIFSFWYIREKKFFIFRSYAIERKGTVYYKLFSLYLKLLEQGSVY